MWFLFELNAILFLGGIMGTFGLPETETQKEDAIKDLKKFSRIKNKLMEHLGDDILWDFLDSAERRAKYLLDLLVEADE